MGKIPGLVNYSDDEDQSSSSGDEDNQQQQKSKQLQPQTVQSQSRQHLSTQSKPQPQSQPELILRPEQQHHTKLQDNTDIKSNESSSPATPTQRTNPPSSVPASLIGDRSSQLKKILTPKPLPGVENWGIPPEPQSECDPDRLEKIKHFLSLRQSGHRLNDHLQRNKAFRNPRIYAKLVEFVELNETGSNFSLKDFDPTFPASSYIDGILETQKRIATEKAQQQAQGRSQLSFVSSSSSNKPIAPLSVDANAKLAAAMANAAKIANKIAKPMPQQQQQQQQQPQQQQQQQPVSSSSHDHHHSDQHSSHKRISHRQWDQRDEKRRHRR